MGELRSVCVYCGSNAGSRPVYAERAAQLGARLAGERLTLVFGGGNVASAGLAASAGLEATVMPFIIRGVSLLGVASGGTARDIRDEIWRRLASDWKPAHLDAICTREVGLAGLPAVFARMLAGGSLGRTLVTF